MGWNEGSKSFEAAEALEQARRVKVNSSGTVEYADADAVGDGVTMQRAASGETVAVRMFNNPGTYEITGAGSFSVGDTVYAAADGKVQAVPTAAGTYYKVGKAMEASAADGNIVEIFPAPDAIGETTTVSE